MPGTEAAASLGSHCLITTGDQTRGMLQVPGSPVLVEILDGGSESVVVFRCGGGVTGSS